MDNPKDLEGLLAKLEQRYDSARLAMTAARADFVALSSLAHANPEKVNAARRRLQKAEERMAEISRRLYTVELEA